MWSSLRYRLRALIRRDQMERDLADELQFHLDQVPQQNRPAFGGLEQIKEACRDERGTGAIDRAGQDLRYAWRMFRKHPGFTIAIVGTLGLGIGGATTMFGVVDGVLLKPLPYRDADRIVQIGRTFGGVRVSATSAIDYEVLASRARTLSRVAIARTETADVTGETTPEQLRAAVVSASYFDVLGVAPAVGQLFSPADDRSGARTIVVVTDRFWRRRLSAAANAVGRTVLVNGQPHTVVAIMPRRFRGPEALDHQDVDLWLPLGRLKLSADPDDAGLGTLGVIANGIDPVLAIREMETLGSAMSAGENTSTGTARFWTAPLQAQTVGTAGSGLWLLFGAVSLLLVLACTNVANLFLVRATERRQEIAVRAALGAGRARIARQLVTETLCFSIAGGVVGAALSYAGIALIRAWAPVDLPRVEDLQVDLRVLGFAFAIASIAGLVFGIAPALDARRTSFVTVLRGTSTSATASRTNMRQRGALVVLQTAMAAMLVVGAALLSNSVLHLANVPPGFDPSNVVWMDVSLPGRAYANAAARLAFFDALQQKLRGSLGVESVSLVQGRPLGGGNSITTVAPEGSLPANSEETPRVPAHIVSPGYFGALRIPLIDGRDFTDDDRLASPRVAIVSRAFADRFWPGARAVGRRVWLGQIAAGAPPVEIVGVAEDVRQYRLDEPPVATVYRPFAQSPRGTATIVIRHTGQTAAGIIDKVRTAAWSLDSALPLERAGTMDAEVSRSIREPRFRALALSAFGAIACAIAAVGLYGTLAWLVRARSREIGVRIALGANPHELKSMVMRRGLLLAAAGVGLGLAGAAATARLLESMVFGISPLDGPTYGAAATVMLIVAMCACWLPAGRAARIDPIATLRE